jgi:D-sedoheptulose 7-phosphate isomerase
VSTDTIYKISPIESFIKAEIQDTYSTFEKILQDNKLIESVQNLASISAKALQNGNKIIFCGNGGSAADSQHLAAELVSKLYKDRPALSAMSLTTDTSAITAIANDYGYDKLFSRQIEAVGNKGDILIGISTSGRSINVINGILKAKELGLTTIAFLGQDGRDIGKISDHQLNIPSDKTPKIQEAHIALGHIYCAVIEKIIFDNA